ncbi:MAG: peptide deformylase [Bacteroidetes bacterium 4572_77]|nr:MAG: peptide deformylase [Bacteroidetes bacterium 4572_77]
MILPIVAYGHRVLKTLSKDIDKDYPDLEVLIAHMFETMYATNGVGLAAPQVNRNIRLFVVDAQPFSEDYPEADGVKKVVINAQILEEEGEEWSFEEGCLSVPDIHEGVMRKPRIKIKYLDENWIAHEEWLDGVVARIVQHEYDHIEGKVFIDRLSSMRRMLLKRKLHDISTGNISTKYRMIFPSLKKGKR